jgi:uncharacterized protein
MMRELQPGVRTAVGQPWWKEPMCWVVIGGPASVVVASLATAVIAWKHIDPIIQEERSGASQVQIQGPPGSSTGPAMQGRNHAASPPVAAPGANP